MKLELICLSIFILITSCAPQENQSLDDEIRNIHTLLNSYEGEEAKTKKVYDSLISSHQKYTTNKNLSEALQCAFVYNFNAGYDILVIEELEKYLKLNDISQQDPLNQFYIYYYMAFKYSEILNMEKTFEYSSKASSFLELNVERYPYERSLISKLMSRSIPQVVPLREQRIKQLIKEYEQYKIKGTSYYPLLDKTVYNIVYQYSNLRDYKKVIEWSEVFVNLKGEIKKTRFYPDLMALYLEALVNSNKTEEGLGIFQQLSEEYDSQELSEKKYNTFLIFSLKPLLGKRDVEEQKAEALGMLSKFEDSICFNRYNLNEIYNFFTLYYRQNNDLNNEVFYLQKKLNTLTHCASSDDYYLNEERQTLERLINVSENFPNDQKFIAYYSRLQKVKGKLFAGKNNYLKLSSYLTGQYLKNFNLAETNEKKLQAQQQKIKHIFFALILILIPSLIIGIYLSFRNNKTLQQIQQNYQALQSNQKEIQKTNLQLESLVERLEQSNINLENFAYMAAKDLKSPLIGINKNVDYIKNKYFDEMEPEDEEIMNFLKSSTYELEEMIEVLLNYSKKEKNIDRLEKINLTKILDNIQDKLAEAIEQSYAKICYPRNFPIIEANTSLMEKVLQNLIANSIKFTPKYVLPKIEIGYNLISDNEIEITVKDNGIGIPESQSKEIFKIFKKLNKSGEYEGSGIGLSTCKKIIEEFNGEIWVESELGKGSEFHIKLPISKKQEANYSNIN